MSAEPIQNLADQEPGKEENALNINFYNVKKASLVLRSLNHKLRQQILQLLDENGRLTVTEIFVRLRLEQSVASQHLAILRHSNVVKTERDGKFIYYALNVPRLDQLASIVEELAK